MRRQSLLIMVAAAAIGIAGFGSRGAIAAMTTGADAPEFTAQAAVGGDVSTFDMKAALAHGPVVLYFFPASFTSGCTAEAHAFAEHIGDFKKLGATVIGVSGDPIDTQKKFSSEACRSKFAVASDPGLKIAHAYDAVLLNMYANRTSYVISPDGKIAYSYTNLDPTKHIENTLAALRALKK